MSDWVKNMGIFWVFVVVDQNGCVFIKFDVGIIFMVQIMFSLYDNGFYNVIFFDNVIWCCLFYSSNNNVINIIGFNMGII